SVAADVEREVHGRPQVGPIFGRLGNAALGRRAMEDNRPSPALGPLSPGRRGGGGRVRRPLLSVVLAPVGAADEYRGGPGLRGPLRPGRTLPVPAVANAFNQLAGVADWRHRLPAHGRDRVVREPRS